MTHAIVQIMTQSRPPVSQLGAIRGAQWARMHDRRHRHARATIKRWSQSSPDTAAWLRGRQRFQLHKHSG